SAVAWAENRVGGRETAGTPAVAEPDVAALAEILRHAVADSDDGKRLGEAGRRRIVEGLTWDHAVAAVEQRLLELCARPAWRPTPVTAEPAVPTALDHGHRMVL